MRNDIDDLVDRIKSMPDSSLVAMLNDDPGNYAPGTISIAEAEVEARGGLDRLTKTPPQDESANEGARFGRAKQSIDNLFSLVIGREPSAKYPGLSYVSIGMRLISFLLGALALGGSILALAALFGQGSFGWVPASIGTFQAGVAALLLFGGSELLNVVIDIEKNTRGARTVNPTDERPTVGE